MKAKLVVVGGDAKTKEVKLRLPCTIGRGRDATLTLPHQLVSRHHCKITEQDGQLVVQDLGSLNGTFVNNVRIEEPTFLPSGELLTVGTITFRAKYGPDTDELPPGVETTTDAAAGTVRTTESLADDDLEDIDFEDLDFDEDIEEIDDAVPAFADSSGPDEEEPLEASEIVDEIVEEDDDSPQSPAEAVVEIEEEFEEIAEVSAAPKFDPDKTVPVEEVVANVQAARKTAPAEEALPADEIELSEEDVEDLEDLDFEEIELLEDESNVSGEEPSAKKPAEKEKKPAKGDEPTIAHSPPAEDEKKPVDPGDSGLGAFLKGLE